MSRVVLVSSLRVLDLRTNTVSFNYVCSIVERLVVMGKERDRDRRGVRAWKSEVVPEIYYVVFK